MRAALRDEPCSLVFRDKSAGGYPGSVRVTNRRGETRVIPASERLRIKGWFTPARCYMCFDKLNVFADITVGDPWGIPEADHEHGESIVVVRTEVGAGAIEAACSAGALSLRELSHDRVVRGQKIHVKRDHWKGYVTAWRALGLPVPGYCERMLGTAMDEKHRLRRFRQQLRWSLMLDNHDTRQALLRLVENRLRRRALLKTPGNLAHLGMRALRRMWRYSHGRGPRARTKGAGLP